MLIFLKVSRIKQVMKEITISLLCSVNPSEIKVLICRISKSEWLKRVIIFHCILSKRFTLESKTVCRKHETVLKATKVWQILVESCLDHADIHDMAAWDSYCSRENEGAKTERFPLFFACICVITDYNLRENTVQRFQTKLQMAFAVDHANKWFFAKISAVSKGRDHSFSEASFWFMIPCSTIV